MGLAYDLFVSIVSLLSVPIHILLMVGIRKVKKYFSRGFYSIIMHLSICHILISLVNAIVALPANYPLVRAFLNENPTLNWIVGVIGTNRGYSLKWVMEIFLAIIALNRLAAVIAPMAFHKRNDAMVTILCFIVWAVFVGIRLPIIWPLHLTIYHPEDAPDRTIYNLEEKGYTTFCIWVGITVGVTTLIITYLSYMIIVIKVFVSHVFGNNKMKPQIRRSVIVACVSTFGLFLMSFTETAEELYWRLWQVDFVQTDTYYLLINAGLEYSIWSLPITMVGMFPELRQQILRFLKLKNNKANIVHVGSNPNMSKTTTRMTA